jgi:DNA modification methylase
MDGCIADMVFTDPPYGVNYQSNMRTKSKKFEVLKNDDVFIDFMPIVEMFSRGWVFVWTSWKVQNKWIELFNSFGYPSNMIVWHKPGGGIGDLKKTFSSDYELGLVWNRGAALCGKRIGSVWTINKDGSTEYKHPTQKPVELATEALDKCTKINANVLDLFGGSGTTLIACEKLKRKCYMMELDNTYIDVIIKRYQNYTGKEAIHEESGKTWNQLSQEMKMEVKT